MLLYVAYLCILFLHQVKSAQEDESIWRDKDDKPIEINEYCEHNKVCVAKCCSYGQIIGSRENEFKCTTNKNITAEFNSAHVLYKMEDTSNKLIETKKNMKSDVLFVRNDIFLKDEIVNLPIRCSYKVLEDGNIATANPGCPGLISKLAFCVDFHIRHVNNTASGTVEQEVIFMYKLLAPDDPDADSKHMFVAVAMLISSFFMLLVLMVYSVLPKLRTIEGMVLMAYLVTQITAFLMKAAQNIQYTIGPLDAPECRIRSPGIFYFIISSFFWLNVMSFDLWWTLRGNRKCRDIHRQGELMKFFWYSLYAWGTPMLLTLLAVLVDRQEWISEFSEYKLPFISCFAEVTSTKVYLHVPIGILIAANWALFLMTAYNVWMIKRGVNNTKDNRNSKDGGGYRFGIYIKLVIFTGANWVLELVPDMRLVPHIIVNSFTLFTGIGIFYIFVCKKDVIIMLSKRLGITNSFIRKLQSSQISKSDTKSLSSRKPRQSLRKHETTELTTATSFVNDPS